MKLKQILQIFVLFSLGFGAEATDYAFNNRSGGNWSISTNWTPTGVPGVADRATIDSGTYTVTLDEGSGAQGQRFATEVRTARASW